MIKVHYQVITRMNEDYSISNHIRVLDDMHYRPLIKLDVQGSLSHDDVLTYIGLPATVIKAGTTSQGYTRLLEVSIHG